MPCCRAVPVKPGGFGFLQLFATLGTSVGKMIINPINKNEENYEYIKPKEILLNDTI